MIENIMISCRNGCCSCTSSWRCCRPIYAEVVSVSKSTTSAIHFPCRRQLNTSAVGLHYSQFLLRYFKGWGRVASCCDRRWPLQYHVICYLCVFSAQLASHGEILAKKFGLDLTPAEMEILTDHDPNVSEWGLAKVCTETRNLFCEISVSFGLSNLHIFKGTVCELFKTLA